MNPNDVSFQIDVSRKFKNKTGYDHGFQLNTSFKTETLTPQSLIDTVIKPGWPYTMAHQKRSPRETGADKRDVKTPKHIENFTSMQVLTFDDDSGEGDVVKFWLNNAFFKQYGWAFVESASSKPDHQKGHPTFIFDKPVIDPDLYKRCLMAFCTAYPRLDWLVDITRTIYNGEGATVHRLDNICPLDVFVREIVEPYVAEEARKQAAIDKRQAEQRAEWERQKAAGKTVSSSLEEAWLAGWLDWVFDKVANTRSGGNPSRNGAIYWAGREIAGAQKTTWTQPYGALFGDVNQRIVAAASTNGYLEDYANGQPHEILRIFDRGIAKGGEELDEPKPARQPETKFAEPREVSVILRQITDLRESRNEYWTRGEDPPDLYEQVKETIRQTGHLNNTDIEKVLVEVERKPAPLAEKSRTELRQIWQAARKFVQSGGVFVVRPERTETWPYDVKSGRLVYLTERIFYDTVTIQQMPVADFHARIVSQITNEDKTRTFLVKGSAVRGGPFQFEMDAEEFGNDRKLKAVIDAASGALDPVRAGMGKHLTAALQLLAGDEMTQYKRYRRTGWADGRFLIPGREPDGVLVEIQDNRPPFKIAKGADLSHGLSALEALLKSMTPERTAPICSLIFQAPLSKIVKWENERYAIFITGRTGSLKTSFAQCLMCIYGAGFIEDEKLIKWGDGATKNALVNLTTIANDMPLLIDNYKPGTGGGARAFISLIHNILEGADKYRLNRASKLRDTKPIHCWPLCTGEDVPDSDPASLARILIMPFLWQNGEDNENLTRAQTFSEHLSAVGGAWLTWLETKDGRQTATRIASKFPQYRSRWAKELKGIRTDTVNSLRVASNLATNELTWEIMCEHPTIGAVAQEYREAHLAGLKTIVAMTMAEATAEALEATRYLAAIKELVATEQVLIPEINEAVLSGLKDRVIGYKDSKGVYIFSKIARRAVERLLNDNLNGISQIALNKQLAGQKLIASHDERTSLKLKWINGKMAKVLHLETSALEDVLTEAKEPEPEQIPF
jgi:hypothetical protein